MRTKRLVTVLAALLLLAVGLTACGSDSKDSGDKASSSSGSTTQDEAGEYGGGSTDSGSASGTAVSIKDLAFSPSTLKVEAGDEVTISNHDGTDHTFTLDDKSFDSGHIGAGKSVTHTFAAAGSYSYHCEIHSSMKGTIEVS